MSRLWQLRRANRQDLEAVLALQVATLLAPQWSEAAWLGYLGEPNPDGSDWRCAFVLEEDGHLLGFIAGRVLGNLAELESIAVNETSRQQGIGRQLLRELSRWAQRRGAETVELEVRESNAAARGFYTAQGFTQQGHRPRYYSDPVETAVLLTRTLPPSL